MVFNLNKCKVLHVCRGNPNFKCRMGGVSLEEVAKERGVMFTDSFKSSKLCNVAAAEANSVLGVIKKTTISRDSAAIAKNHRHIIF